MKHQAKPAAVERKPDCSQNSTKDLTVLMERQREKEKLMYPVRINKYTVVYRLKKNN